MTRESKRGYGQPPKEHQFKKGSSGNPGGRPKRKTHFEVGANMDPEIAELILAEAARPVSIRENGKSQGVSIKAALLRTLNHSGLKGDLRSQVEALKLILAAERFIAEQKSPRTSGCPVCSELQTVTEEELVDRMRDLLSTGRVSLPDGYELIEIDDDDDHSDLA
jgi:hypothetical protein